MLLRQGIEKLLPVRCISHSEVQSSAPLGPIAVAYSLADSTGRAHRAQYFYLHTYSPDYAELRPGTLLLAFAMERAAEEGIEAIDLLRGDEAYKQLWPSEPVPTLGFALPSKELEHASQAA